MRKAVIILTPDDEKCRADITTGGVSDLEILQALKTIMKEFAKRVISDAKEVVGDSDEDQERYINWKIDKEGLNG